MAENEYRVRPVTRYIVTHFISEGEDGGSSCQYGEFDNIGAADSVARSLHIANPGSTFVTIEDRRKPVGTFHTYTAEDTEAVMNFMLSRKG